MVTQTTHRNLALGAGWVLFSLLYIFILAQDSPEGAIVGAGVAAIAFVSMYSAWNHCEFRFLPRWSGYGLLARRVPGQVLGGFVRLVVGLQRQWRPRHRVSGKFRAVPFDPGGKQHDAAARRALVTAAISIAPDTYVVYIDKGKRRLVLHELIARKISRKSRAWPL